MSEAVLLNELFIEREDGSDHQWPSFFFAEMYSELFLYRMTPNLSLCLIIIQKEPNEIDVITGLSFSLVQRIQVS